MLMEVRVSVSNLFLVSPFLPMMYLEVQKYKSVAHTMSLGRSSLSVSRQQINGDPDSCVPPNPESPCVTCPGPQDDVELWLTTGLS